MDINVLNLSLVVIIGFFGLGILGFIWWAESTAPKAKTTGSWVAEVWIDWEICHGSTMYRQRFNTKWGAYLAVRARAFGLDFLLPSSYWDTDWSGKPVRIKHEFCIRYGVRRLSEKEQETFNTVYSTVLPGEEGCRAEHSGYRLAILDELQLEENGIVG
jgi:hypothetical protein